MSPCLSTALGRATFVACACVASSLLVAGPALSGDAPLPRPKPDRPAAGAPPPAALPSVRGVGMLCGVRKAIVASLSERHGESRRAIGLQSGNRVLELWASPSGSWTALITDATGRSCILGVGEAWTTFAAPPAGDPA